MFVCSLVALSDARHAPVVSMPSFWGVVSRGGSVLKPTIPSSSRQQVAVGFVRVAADSRSSQSAIFYSGSSVYTSSTLEEDSIETLAITSDVLLLMVDPSLSSQDQQRQQLDHVADSIVRGAARRRDAGFPKLAVLLVATGTSKRDDPMAASADPTSTATASAANSSNDSWKERILSDRLAAALTPDLVASLDIASETTAEAAYQDVISDLPLKGVVTDIEEYRLMIQQVYQTLTNKECEIVFDTAKSSFFESSGDTKVGHEEVSIAPLSEQGSAPVAVEDAIVPKINLSGHDLQGVDQDLLAAAMRELEHLESQQEEVWLSSDAQVPMLHFGSSADSILNKACDAVERAPSVVQEAVLEQLTGKLRVLYNNQLQSLREQFGRKYEKVLEEHPDDDEAQVAAVARITDGFRVAAQHAIPELCREGQRLVDADFSYVSSLQGLLSDMMEATSMRQDVDEDVEPAEEGSSPTKWYKKVAAQALMVGVNYIQGWLACRF